MGAVIALAALIAWNNVDLSARHTLIPFGSVTVAGEVIPYDREIWDVAAPLFFDGGERAVLLLHGFGGTPVELSDLARYLADRGITVYVPLLAGHGMTLEALRRTTWKDEYADAKAALDILRRHHPKVYVGGLSTGGLLALALAEDGAVDGVVSLAAPLVLSSRFADFVSSKWFYYVLRVLTPYLRRVPYGLARNPEVAKRLPSFDLFPVNGLLTVDDLTRRVKERLGDVRCPVLIVQSEFDNRASPHSAKYLFDRVGGAEKDILWLKNSGHLVTMDYDKDEVFKAVLDFITQH